MQNSGVDFVVSWQEHHHHHQQQQQQQQQQLHHQLHPPRCHPVWGLLAIKRVSGMQVSNQRASLLAVLGCMDRQSLRKRLKKSPGNVFLHTSRQVLPVLDLFSDVFSTGSIKEGMCHIKFLKWPFAGQLFVCIRALSFVLPCIQRPGWNAAGCDGLLRSRRTDE